jgi:hypothetical protein
MAEYLKRGKPAGERAEDDAKVRATVEGILAISRLAVMRRCANCPRNSTVTRPRPSV